MIRNNCKNFSVNGGIPRKTGRYTSHHALHAWWGVPSIFRGIPPSTKKFYGHSLNPLGLPILPGSQHLGFRINQVHGSVHLLLWPGYPRTFPILPGSQHLGFRINQVHGSVHLLLWPGYPRTFPILPGSQHLGFRINQVHGSVQLTFVTRLSTYVPHLARFSASGVQD